MISGNLDEFGYPNVNYGTEFPFPWPDKAPFYRIDEGAWYYFNSPGQNWVKGSGPMAVGDGTTEVDPVDRIVFDGTFLVVSDAGGDDASIAFDETEIDHDNIQNLGNDGHPQYLKEKSQGGLASEIPEHDHSSAGEGGTIALDDIANPGGSKNFNMANKYLHFHFTNTAGGPTEPGAFEIEAIGAFTGDLFHVHQHTGNPGVGTHLVHLEYDDTDVTPLAIIGPGPDNFEFNPVSGLGWKMGGAVAYNIADSDTVAILTGKAGGQTLIGGTAVSENLELQSTSHATRGYVSFLDDIFTDRWLNHETNTIIGYEAAGGDGLNNLGGVEGQRNTIIGYRAGYSITEGRQNVIMGPWTGDGLTEGHSNVFIGMYAGDAITSEDANVMMGYECGTNMQGSYNTVIGYQAGYADSGGSRDNNAFFGRGAGRFNQAVSNQVGIGAFAGYHNTTGIDMCAIGNNALTYNETGSRNVAVGSRAGRGTVQGHNKSDCTYVGWYSGNENQSGSRNTSLGSYTMYRNQTGADNTMLGYGCGFGASGNSYSYNVGVGKDCLLYLETGEYNVVVGWEAGESMTDGDGNVLIGPRAGQNITTGTYNVCIGYNAADGQLTTESHKLWIENTANTPPLIYGEFDNDYVVINDQLGVNLGTSQPSVELQINQTNDYPTIRTQRMDKHGDSVIVGGVQFYGKNDNGAEGDAHEFAAIIGYCADDATGAEEGRLQFYNHDGGGSHLTMELLNNVVHVADRIGVGTSSPGYDCHIYDASSVYYRGLVVNSDGTNAQVLMSLKNDAQTWDMMVDSSDHFAIRDATYSIFDPFRVEANGVAHSMRIFASGHTGLGTATDTTSAMLNVVSTTGAVLLPRMTTAQRNALTAVAGMIIYNTTTGVIEGYEGAAWVNL
jgi:hypothetical protein